MFDEKEKMIITDEDEMQIPTRIIEESVKPEEYANQNNYGYISTERDSFKEDE